MREVSDAFLLTMAEVSAVLTGLYLFGVLFFAESGFRRLEDPRGVVVPYFRAGTRIVLISFALPLGLSLTLVALSLNWSRVLFALFSIMLVSANVDTLLRIRAFTRATGSTALLLNELLGTLAVLALVVIPWALGGLQPTREDLTWAILLSFASGFFSVSALVLLVFDTARSESPAQAAAGKGWRR
jgi:hypothetical protein